MNNSDEIEVELVARYLRGNIRKLEIKILEKVFQKEKESFNLSTNIVSKKVDIQMKSVDSNDKLTNALFDSANLRINSAVSKSQLKLDLEPITSRLSKLEADVKDIQKLKALIKTLLDDAKKWEMIIEHTEVFGPPEVVPPPLDIKIARAKAIKPLISIISSNDPQLQEYDENKEGLLGVGGREREKDELNETSFQLSSSDILSTLDIRQQLNFDFVGIIHRGKIQKN